MFYSLLNTELARERVTNAARIQEEPAIAK
jgi:hypothetical protein